MKIQLFSLSGLWCDLQKFLWPFLIFLRSLMPKNSSGMQKSYFWTGFLHKKLTNQKSHSESLCNQSVSSFCFFEAKEAVEVIEASDVTMSVEVIKATEVFKTT